MNQRKGLARIIAATGYSYKGVKAAWKHEEAFRQEVVLMLLMAPLAFWVGDNFAEQMILLGSVVLVVVVELLNSAIEAITDRVSTDYHKLSGRAKDMGSAAVFVALFLMIFVWGVKIYQLLM
ncbi:diacylglycerol kinase [Neiella marina]|uniref:Diacylglycerol kinase n=1 Tax=Neiella holothuriorum TaxID=2870530 RepID=A0ABS7EIH9_9GAMM|nr:diacylglycerol kinase [Neiella holothuriorum]MBW8192159.1 diacylglycerol kinase [Neiella holothuriorum]